MKFNQIFNSKVIELNQKIINTVIFLCMFNKQNIEIVLTQIEEIVRSLFQINLKAPTKKEKKLVFQ